MSRYLDHDAAAELVAAIDDTTESEGTYFTSTGVDQNGAYAEFTLEATTPDGEVHLFSVQVRAQGATDQRTRADATAA